MENRNAAAALDIRQVVTWSHSREFVDRSSTCDDQNAGAESEDCHDEGQAAEAEVGQTDEPRQDQPGAEQEHAETLLHGSLLG
jgi:hypothetical protein